MVMAHTIQEDGLIKTRCDGRIILIDIGLSRAMEEFGGRCGVLEITRAGEMNALYCDDTSSHNVLSQYDIRSVRVPLNVTIGL